METIKCERYNEDIKQHLFKYLVDDYIVIQRTVKVEDNDNNLLLAMMIKDFFTEEEYDTLQKYILGLKNESDVYKMEIPIDSSIEHISKKVHETNKKNNHDLVNHFSTLHVFDNYLVDIHRDSEERSIKNLFIVKCDELKGLTVFPEYKIAFMLEPRDVLFFDTSLLHYVSSNKMISKKRYRYAMYFE